MNYTISQLKIFLKITETQSVTKASEELHLTQPAVSIQLKNLQAQFEIPLTEIVGRKIFITDFGREIAVAAERILNEVNAINYKTLAHKGKLSGNLKISVVSTGQYIIPYFLSGFLKQHEGIDLQLDVNKSQVIKSLENNEVDFSLVSVLPDKMKLNKLELMQNQLYLIGNKDKKFTKKTYDKTIFETLPLIYREAGSGTRHVMEKFILKNKLPVKGFPIRSVWNLIWLKEKGFSVVANSFLTYLKSEKQNIIRERFDWFDSYAAK
jgi:DNA-binding transcriptional LysR family regulator